MPPKRKYSGVLQTVSNTSFQVIHFSVCEDTVKPAKSVRDLGIFLDIDMSMKTHVSRTVSSCFAALRQIRSIRRSVSQPVLLSRHLVGAVAFRLRQCKAHRNILTLAGSSAVLQCLTRQQDCCATAENTIILHLSDLCCVIYTGFASQNVLRSVWPFLCSAATIARQQNTWRETCSGRAVDGDSRKRLRSASGHKLVVRLSRLKTFGDRVFGVAAPRVWNGLLSDVTSAQSLSTFKKHSKTSFPTVIYLTVHVFCNLSLKLRLTAG